MQQIATPEINRNYTYREEDKLCTLEEFKALIARLGECIHLERLECRL